jgi:hypothetical protein
MTMLDVALPPTVVLVTQGVMRTISVIITVIVVNPWLLIVAVVCAILVFYTYR